jgi:hypothetical protein
MKGGAVVPIFGAGALAVTSPVVGEATSGPRVNLRTCPHLKIRFDNQNASGEGRDGDGRHERRIGLWHLRRASLLLR